VTFSVKKASQLHGCVIVYRIDRLCVFNIIQKMLKRYHIVLSAHFVEGFNSCISKILPITA